MCFNDHIVELEGIVDCIAECVPLGSEDWFVMECGWMDSTYFHAEPFGCWGRLCWLRPPRMMMHVVVDDVDDDGVAVECL